MEILILLLAVAVVNCQNIGNSSEDKSVSTEKQTRTGCGWRNPNGVGFEIQLNTDSEYTKFGEFPWVVAIFKVTPSTDKNDTDLQYIGGGSLITPSVVLTTAHDKTGDGVWRVRAGDWDMQTTKEIYAHQERDVKRVDVHKDFNKGNLFYDIAVLFLEKPMDLAPNVGVACLPPADEQVDAGTRCFASGWGARNFENEGTPIYDSILKKVEIPVVDRNTCKNELRKTRLKGLFELHSTFMCAGGEAGKDTCIGDGGSPLVCPAQYEPDRYIQYGIVSWGIGCGNETPAVYVDVSKLRHWIDDKVAGSGVDPSVYTLL